MFVEVCAICRNVGCSYHFSNMLNCWLWLLHFLVDDNSMFTATNNMGMYK